MARRQGSEIPLDRDVKHGGTEPLLRCGRQAALKVHNRTQIAPTLDKDLLGADIPSEAMVWQSGVTLIWGCPLAGQTRRENMNLLLVREGRRLAKEWATCLEPP